MKGNTRFCGVQINVSIFMSAIYSIVHSNVKLNANTFIRYQAPDNSRIAVETPSEQRIIFGLFYDFWLGSSLYCVFS